MSCSHYSCFSSINLEAPSQALFLLDADGHPWRSVAGAFSVLHLRLHELTSSSLVDDQRLFAWAGVLAVWHADVRPAIKLADDLVIG